MSAVQYVLYIFKYVIDDREECIKLVDFSTARDVANSNSILYDCAGTMGFRSPEQ